MDLTRMISELTSQRDDLDRSILSLEALISSRQRKQGRPRRSGSRALRFLATPDQMANSLAISAAQLNTAQVRQAE